MVDRVKTGRRKDAQTESSPLAAEDRPRETGIWEHNFCGGEQTGLMSMADADADLKRNNPLYRKICKVIEECDTIKDSFGADPEWEKRWDRT